MLHLWHKVQVMAGLKQKKNKISKPILLVLFNFLLLLIIPVNYFLICFRNDISSENFRQVFLSASIMDWMLILPPLFIVPGIAFLKKWAWMLLIAYTLYSIFINSYAAIMIPSDYNLGALGQALFAMLSLFYFIEKDIRNAFFKTDFRGWRISERYTMQTEIGINGRNCKCVNISPGGCSVYWPNCPLKSNMPVLVTFQLTKNQFVIKGRIIRIAPSGEVGISFVNTEVKTQKVLSEILAGIS